jgi:hypothetical protein
MNNTRFAYLCVLLISLPFLAPFYRHGPLAFSLRSERPVRRFCGAVHESPRSLDYPHGSPSAFRLTLPFPPQPIKFLKAS